MVKIAALVLFLAMAPAWGDVIFLNASLRGSVESDGSSNGASANNFFFAGLLLVQDRNWFEFSIPTISSSSTLASATFNLAQSQFGHLGGQLVYSIYALGSQPTQFSDVNATTLYGSVNTSPSTNGELVSITLDSAALAAIVGAQGGDLFIGGIDSGENSSPFSGDFASSNNYQTFLKLTTVPEPSHLGSLVIAIFALGMVATNRSRFQRSSITRST